MVIPASMDNTPASSKQDKKDLDKLPAPSGQVLHARFRTHIRVCPSEANFFTLLVEISLWFHCGHYTQSS